MTPIITNLLAETRHNERIAATRRPAARARLQLARQGTGDAFAGESFPPVLTLPGMGVRRPCWWAALEAGETVRVGGDACAEPCCSQTAG